MRLLLHQFPRQGMRAPCSPEMQHFPSARESQGGPTGWILYVKTLKSLDPKPINIHINHRSSSRKRQLIGMGARSWSSVSFIRRQVQMFSIGLQYSDSWLVCIVNPMTMLLWRWKEPEINLFTFIGTISIHLANMELSLVCLPGTCLMSNRMRKHLYTWRQVDREWILSRCSQHLSLTTNTVCVDLWKWGELVITINFT